jgi:hypothetical protein
MEEIRLALPAEAHSQALSMLYFDKMHPIFPIIDKHGFHKLRSTDPVRILLQQGICLAASKHNMAKEHLILRDADSSPLSHRAFAERILAAMRLTVEHGLVTDKIALIQALALMSHFANGLDDSSDLSAQLCGCAVHYAHSIGLHLQGHMSRSHSNQYNVTLLCCIWALDRLNAAFHGRPVLIHERDVGRNLEECAKEQEPCFRLFLAVIKQLDAVIQLYRPSSSVTGEMESGPAKFLAFEDLVAACAGTQIAMPMLGMRIPVPPPTNSKTRISSIMLWLLFLMDSHI